MKKVVEEIQALHDREGGGFKLNPLEYRTFARLFLIPPVEPVTTTYGNAGGSQEVEPEADDKPL